MDGFREIANLNQPDNNDPLINKLGREFEVVVGGTLIGLSKGLDTTLQRPESLLGVAGGAVVGTGLSALQLRFPGFRPAGAMLAGGFAYFGIKNAWNRAPAMGEAIADTWESPKNLGRNFNTLADNAGVPLWDAYLFWGGGRLASGATSSYLYRPGGPLVKVPEQYFDGKLIPHRRTDPIAQAFENTKQGVVQVEIPKVGTTQSAFGTGFLVSADGKIATNAHVAMHALEHSGSTTKIYHQGESMTAQVLKVDLVNDLAVLKVNELDKLAKMKPLTLAHGDPELGHSLFLSGHPRGERGISITQARYDGNTRLVTEVRDVPNPGLPYKENTFDRVAMPWKKDDLVATKEGFSAYPVTHGMLTFPSRAGMSGSPVFDQTGQVFGVHQSVSIFTGRAYHSRVDALKQLLSKLEDPKV